MGTGLALLAGLGGLSWWGLTYVNEELAPAIAQDLSQALNRPVELGPVQSYTLSSVQFGPSAIPPYQRSLNGQVIQESDSATTTAVNVRFDLWEALWTRTLGLDVQLVQPRLHLEQSEDGQWLDLNLELKDSNQWFKTELNTLRFAQGQAQLVPFKAAPHQIHHIAGRLSFTGQNRNIQFGTVGQLPSGGQVTVQGEWSPASETLALQAKTEDVVLSKWASLLPALPINIRTGQVNGTFQLQYRPNQPWIISSHSQIRDVDLTWPQESVRIKAQRFKGKIRVQYEPNQDLAILGQAQVNGGDVWVPEDRVLLNGRSRRQRWQGVNGTLNFLPKTRQVQFDLKGKLAAGGRLWTRGKAALGLDKARMLLQVRDLSAPLLDQAYKLPLRVRAGRVNADLQVTLRQDRQPYLLGMALLNNGQGEIIGLPQPFRQVNSRMRFRGLTTTLDSTQALYGQVPVQASGVIDPDRGFSLTAKTAVVEVNRALETLRITDLPVPVKGQVQVPQLQVTGAINKPILSGTVLTQGTPILDRVPFRQIKAQFQMQEQRLNITEIEGLPLAGGVISGEAQLDVRPRGQLSANLQARNLPGNAIAQLYQAQPGFDIGPVAAEVQLYGPPKTIKTDVQFQAQQATYPTTGDVLVRSGITYLRDIVAQIPGGDLHIEGQIANNQVQAITSVPGLTLSEIAPDLRGTLTGQIALAGPLQTFSSETVRGQGNLRFSNGISLIQQPIDAQVGWDGRQILVRNATAPGFRATGQVGARLTGPQSPQLTTLNLDIQAQDYALQTLPPVGPTHVALQGRADLTGQLTGTVTAPNLAAAVAVDHLGVAQLGFEPTLKGRLDYGFDRGLSLSLRGDRDRVELALKPSFEPTSFDIQQGQAIATGRTQGNQLLVDIQQFPLLALGLRPAETVGLGQVSGLGSGNFVVNWGDRSLEGTIAVAQPGIVPLVGDQFRAQVRFANGVATLTQGQLTQGNNQFQIEAQLEPGDNPHFSGQIQVDRTQIEDVIATLPSLQLEGINQKQTPTAYGTAADVQTTPVGNPQALLGDQLKRLAEVDRLIALQQTQNQHQSTWPDLADLTGQITGQIQFSGSQQGGLEGSFDLQSDPLDWNQTRIDQMVAKGQWQDKTLTLAPLSITTGEGVASFKGQLGPKSQSGQLHLSKLPLQELQKLAALPITMSGQLGGEATLSGSLANPQLKGEFSLANATLNDTAVEMARSTLAYDQARLQVQGSILLDTPEPILFRGSVPYSFPFASVKPDNDQLSASLTVKDQGLALLNVFTDQVNWVDGQGKLDIQASGTLEQPVLNGMLTVANATLKTQLLSQPLTDVSGAIAFDRDRLSVSQLTGAYSKGKVSAAGSLPIVTASPLLDPLTVQLNDLDLMVQNLYKGQIAGDLRITGSLFEPELGGSVQLSRGQVLLAGATNPDANTPASNTTTEPLATAPLRFKDLKVQLGDRVWVSQPPLLRFLASGDVAVNGLLSDPRPEGIIRFRKGTINLFTTLFRVDPGQENYAQFQPKFGLDPYLNVGLVTSVTEVNQGQISGFNELNSFDAITGSNEFVRIPTGTLGSLESIRVKAIVDGQASELTKNFERVVTLTSTPDRSRREILALLGGGVTESLQAGDTGAAVVSLASSAVLTNFEGLIDNLLGNRVSFRAFPVLIPIVDEEDRANTSARGQSGIQFGAELGYDVTDQFSISVLQILTGSDRPTLLNLSYDINQQFRARTAIDTNGEAVGVLEYRLRF